MNNYSTKTCDVMFGWGAFKAAPGHLSRLGQHPLILTGGRSVRRLGYLDTLLDGLKEQNCSPVVFEGVDSDPTFEVVDQAARLAIAENCDFIIGMGGGSVIDAAKGVAAIAHNRVSAWDLTAWGRSDGKEPAAICATLPIAAIPTRAGSGSEVNGTGVLCNHTLQQKAVFYDDRLKPILAIVDPALTVTVDPVNTFTGAMDLIAHGIEDHFTQQSPDPGQGARCAKLVNSALTMAEKAIQFPQDKEARTALSNLALEVWDGTYNGPETPWQLHAIAHVVGARQRLPHGYSIAILMPAWLALIKDADASRFLNFSQRLELSPLFLPALPELIAAVWDSNVMASEIIEIYGERGALPGWPKLTHREVELVLAQTLRHHKKHS